MSKVVISKKIFEGALRTYGKFYKKLNGVSAKKSVTDTLSTKKVMEQVILLESYLARSIKGVKILEVGSGYGVFVISGTLDYDADVYGVEPSAEGFGGSFETSQELLVLNGLESNRIKCGVAEDLPFEDCYFDVVYSTNVFEHVQNPEKAFAEAIRVCKKGGLIQVVVPNYGSFYEGHYGCWYVPYTPKWIWKKYIKYVLKKDPAYADTLQTGLNYFSVKRILKPYTKKGLIDVLSFGEEVAYKRITTGEFAPYAGLKKVQHVVMLLRKIGVASFVGKVLTLTKTHSPLIITLIKK